MLASNRSGRTLSRGNRYLTAGLALLALWLPCALWAFPPDALPSAAIWNNFMTKIHEEAAVLVEPLDQNGDNVVDLKIYQHTDGSYIDVALAADGVTPSIVTLRDTRKDKRFWVFGFDMNNDGALDTVVQGMFAEGKYDQMICDSDRDGHPDKFLRDMDQNGVYDCMGQDENADGRLDYLYDLDNKTGEILDGSKTVGWVVFKEQQHREALPKLWYSFTPELNTLTGAKATVVSATWNFGDGMERLYDDLTEAPHVYREAGRYEVTLDVEFRLPGDEAVWKAWTGLQLPIEPGPAGPPPMSKEVAIGAARELYGICGLVANTDQPQIGLISELWPEVKLPETAPAGEALKNSAVAPGELDLAVFWWRSEPEADAFLDALMAGAEPKPDLPVMVERTANAQTFELASKQRAHFTDVKGVRTASWREGAFVVTMRTNRTTEELQRWMRLFYDLLHPAPVQPKDEAEG